MTNERKEWQGKARHGMAWHGTPAGGPSSQDGDGDAVMVMVASCPMPICR